ncbi:hypothetical protein D3C86_1656180 [compost metagenome]
MGSKFQPGIFVYQFNPGAIRIGNCTNQVKIRLIEICSNLRRLVRLSGAYSFYPGRILCDITRDLKTGIGIAYGSAGIIAHRVQVPVAYHWHLFPTVEISIIRISLKRGFTSKVSRHHCFFFNTRSEIINYISFLIPDRNRYP